MIDGRDSGIRTIFIISNTEAPIARLDSITPLSISLILDSVTLAKKGAADIDKGTIVAVMPIFRPTIILVNKNSSIIKIIKGIDLKILITPPNILLNIGFSHILSFSVINNNTPKGKPTINAKNTERITIYKVSQVAVKIKSDIISTPYYHYCLLERKELYLLLDFHLLILLLDGLH